MYHVVKFGMLADGDEFRFGWGPEDSLNKTHIKQGEMAHLVGDDTVKFRVLADYDIYVRKAAYLPIVIDIKKRCG